METLALTVPGMEETRMHGTTKVFINRLAEAVDDLCEWPIPEEDAVDLVGEINRLIRKLSDPYKSGPGLVQRLMSEVPATAVGETYRTASSNSATRSYNTNGLLGAFGAKTIGDPLPVLVSAGAMKVSWNWTKLQTAANAWDVTLVVAKHEIEDGDPSALVGEVWKTTTKVEPKETA